MNHSDNMPAAALYGSLMRLEQAKEAMSRRAGIFPRGISMTASAPIVPPLDPAYALRVVMHPAPSRCDDTPRQGSSTGPPARRTSLSAETEGAGLPEFLG